MKIRWQCLIYCIALRFTALHCACIALHCTTLYCIALYCVALHCNSLHCIVLYCIVLHCIEVALHCIVLQRRHHAALIGWEPLTITLCKEIKTESLLSISFIQEMAGFDETIVTLTLVKLWENSKQLWRTFIFDLCFHTVSRSLKLPFVLL